MRMNYWRHFKKGATPRTSTLVALGGQHSTNAQLSRGYLCRPIAGRQHLRLQGALQVRFKWASSILTTQGFGNNFCGKGKKFCLDDRLLALVG